MTHFSKKPYCCDTCGTRFIQVGEPVRQVAPRSQLGDRRGGVSLVTAVGSPAGACSAPRQVYGMHFHHLVVLKSYMHLPTGESTWRESGRACYLPLKLRGWTPICAQSITRRVSPQCMQWGRCFHHERQHQHCGVTSTKVCHKVLLPPAGVMQKCHDTVTDLHHRESAL